MMKDKITLMECLPGDQIRLENVDGSLSSLIFVVKYVAVKCEVVDHSELYRFFVGNRRCVIVRESPIRKNLPHVGTIDDEY